MAVGRKPTCGGFLIAALNQGVGMRRKKSSTKYIIIALIAIGLLIPVLAITGYMSTTHSSIEVSQDYKHAQLGVDCSNATTANMKKAKTLDEEAVLLGRGARAGAQSVDDIASSYTSGEDITFKQVASDLLALKEQDQITQEEYDRRWANLYSVSDNINATNALALQTKIQILEQAKAQIDANIQTIAAINTDNLKLADCTRKANQQYSFTDAEISDIQGFVAKSRARD